MSDQQDRLAAAEFITRWMMGEGFIKLNNWMMKGWRDTMFDEGIALWTEVLEAAGVTAPPAEPRAEGLREALKDAVRILSGGRPGYVGDHYIREVQVKQTTVDRLKGVLAAAPPQRAVPEAASPTLRAWCVCGKSVLPENWANHLKRRDGRYHEALQLTASQPTPAPLDHQLAQAKATIEAMAGDAADLTDLIGEAAAMRSVLGHLLNPRGRIHDSGCGTCDAGRVLLTADHELPSARAYAQQDTPPGRFPDERMDDWRKRADEIIAQQDTPEPTGDAS